MIKYRNKKKQYSKKLTPRNLYPQLRIARSLRPFKSNENYLSLKLEYIDYLQTTAGSNLTTFSSSGFTFMNINGMLALTRGWVDHASGFFFFRINKVTIAHYRCLSESSMDLIFGIDKGSMISHYRLYSEKINSDMGIAPQTSDMSKTFSPLEWGRKVTLPFDKVNGMGVNTPWKNWATVSALSSCPGQLSYNDGNGYQAAVTAKPYMVRLTFYVTFKSAYE